MAASVSSVVAAPRMSSMSGMTGTGLKKCMPTNRAPARRGDRLGQPVDRDRARVRGEDRAGRRDAGRARAHSARLDGEVLEDRLDDEVRVGGRAPRSSVGDDPRRGSRRAPSRQPALGDGPLEVAGDPVATGLGPREVRLVQRDLLADRRVDLGDAVAHQAGAGDEDPLDRHPAQRYRADGAAAGRASRRRARRAAAPPTTATTAADDEERRRRSRRHRRASPRSAGASPNARSRNTLVVPTTAPRSVSSTATTASASSAGNVNATPDARRRRADEQPGGARTRPMIASPTAATTSATPDSRAAPNRSGQLREDDQAQHDDDQRVRGRAARRRRHARARRRSSGHEREEAGHPPSAEEDQDARQEPGRVEQSAARRRPLAGPRRSVAGAVSGTSSARTAATTADARRGDPDGVEPDGRGPPRRAAGRARDRGRARATRG